MIAIMEQNCSGGNVSRYQKRKEIGTECKLECYRGEVIPVLFFLFIELYSFLQMIFHISSYTINITTSISK